MGKAFPATPRTVAGSTAPTTHVASVSGVTASCSRPACQRQSVATLTYDYAARVATVDDLAPAHPMQYDLCADHTSRLSVPNGWQLVDRRVTRVVDLDERRLAS